MNPNPQSLTPNPRPKQARKKASKSELKKIKKEIAAKRKSGIECYTDEELENAGFLPDV